MSSRIPVIPESAPFTAEQRAWLNGFLAGVFSRGGPAPATGALATAARAPLLVLFGSQSGNAECLAKKLSKMAATRGFQPRLASMEAVAASDLVTEKNVLLLTSTWGEGDMPESAVGFWNGLNQNGTSPALTGVNFSVLALGDRNYGDTFCLAGRKLDARLAELGARRVFDRVDCDVDYDAAADQWMTGVVAALGAPEAAVNLPEAVITVTTPPPPPSEGGSEETGWSRKNPFPAPLLANVCLNGRGSAKETRHIVLSLEDSGLTYEAGDALGVFPANCPDVVARVMEAQRLDSGVAVPLPDGGEAPLKNALLWHYEIRGFVGRRSDPPVTPRAFVEGLRRLQPRLYSIASSPRAHPGQVHVCVGAVRYAKDGLEHKGVASTYLADRLPLGGTIGVFIHKAPHFRLPADSSTPVIMVGPGTGVAPFRAFLEERAMTGATGKNWLFFGDQHEACDYLYRDEIESFLRSGLLTRLDLAFSRDQAGKVYVQNRMMTHATDLFEWLEQGAHVYVCGDASKMAKDVDAALHHLIESSGGKSAEAAAAYVADLRKARRYQRDVY